MLWSCFYATLSSYAAEAFSRSHYETDLSVLFSLGAFSSLLIKPDFMHRLWSEIQIKSPGCFALAEAFFFLFFFSDNTFSIQSLDPICLFCVHHLRWNPSDLHPIWLISPEYISPLSLCLQYAGEEMWLKKTNFLSFLITFCNFANGNMAACPVFLGNMDGLVVKLLFSTRLLKNFCIFSHWVHGRRSVCACMQRAICVCPSIAGSVRVSLHLPHGWKTRDQKWSSLFPNNASFWKAKNRTGSYEANGGCWEIRSGSWGQAFVVEDVLIRAQMFVHFFVFFFTFSFVAVGEKSA